MTDTISLRPTPRREFPVRPAADRNAFLAILALVWIGVLSGFATDSFSHLQQFGLDYPLIVHFHAVAFVSWLVLFTVQVSLIRLKRPDLHRRLGLAGAVLAGVMVFLGPATALIYDAQQYAAHGETPEFLAVQFIDILAFATFTGSGLLLRRSSAAHKRLMLMGLIYISDAGFARFLNPLVSAHLGTGFWGTMATLYLGSNLLLLGLGGYDLATRGKLQPVYIVGVAWAFTLQVTAYTLLNSPGWKAISLHLIGH